MHRALIAVRPFSINLRAFRLASSATSSKKEAFIDHSPIMKGALPIKMINLLKDFESNVPPTSEHIKDQIKEFRPHHMRFLLYQMLQQNSPSTFLVLMPHFMEHGLINDKNIIPTVQTLTRAWFKFGSTDQIKAISSQLMTFLPYTDVRNDLRVLLDACSDEWPIFDSDRDSVYMLKKDCYNALVVGSLRHSDLKQLKWTVKASPKMYIHNDPDVFQLFCDSIKPGDTSLLSIYLNHLNGQIITEEIFYYISRVFKITEVGKLTQSKVIDGTCKVCKAELETRFLSNGEFVVLRDKFTEFLKQKCETNKEGTKFEFAGVRKLINKVKSGAPYKSAIVVDALNIVRGQMSATHEFVEAIRELKKQYDVVVLVSRQKFINSEPIAALRQNGVYTLSVGRYSNDDLFAICAALHLGQDALLVTNDRFTDVIHELNKDTKIAELFTIWNMNQVVDYSLPLKISEPNHYSNLLSYSPKSKTCHFVVFNDSWQLRRKLYCLKH